MRGWPRARAGPGAASAAASFGRPYPYPLQGPRGFLSFPRHPFEKGCLGTKPFGPKRTSVPKPRNSSTTWPMVGPLGSLALYGKLRNGEGRKRGISAQRDNWRGGLCGCSAPPAGAPRSGAAHVRASCVMQPHRGPAREPPPQPPCAILSPPGRARELVDRERLGDVGPGVGPAGGTATWRPRHGAGQHGAEPLVGRGEGGAGWRAGVAVAPACSWGCTAPSSQPHQ